MANDAQIPTKEAADIAQVSVKTLLRWSEQGRIHPTAKLPGLRGAFLWNRADVLALERGVR